MTKQTTQRTAEPAPQEELAVIGFKAPPSLTEAIAAFGKGKRWSRSETIRAILEERMVAEGLLPANYLPN